jgi:hypothetical protein
MFIRETNETMFKARQRKAHFRNEKLSQDKERSVG